MASRQSGRMVEKICLCLTCPAIMARLDAFALESFDQLRKLSQRKPVNRRRPAILDLGKSFFFDRSHDNFESLRARCIEHEKRKLAIARDKAKTFHRSGQWLVAVVSAGLTATDPWPLT